MTDERDALAEQWLLNQHDPDWYIGDATTDEWKVAYEYADRILSR